MWREFEIATRSTKMEDLGIDDDQSAKFSIDLSQVVAYYETYSDKDEMMTNLVTRGGGEYAVFMEYKDFDLIMKKYANS